MDHDQTLIVYFGDYTGGAAGAKRVRQFAQGIIHAGGKLRVVGIKRRQQTISTADIWEQDAYGITFTSMLIPAKNENIWRKIIAAIDVSQSLAKQVLKLYNSWKFDRVIVYGNSWFAHRCWLRAVNKLGIPVYADMNEYYMPWGRGPFEFVDQVVFRKLLLGKMAGIIGISSFWERYAERKELPCIEIPAMSDDEFLNMDFKCYDKLQLTYVGILFKRDLPQKMLELIQHLVALGLDFQFNVVGKRSASRTARNFEHAINGNTVLENCVKFHGWQTRENLIRLYEDTSAFVIFRQKGTESDASFPTRLPEMLSMGRLVLTNATEDVHDILVSNDNALLIEDNMSAQDIAKQFADILTDHDALKRIGQRAKALSYKEYHYTIHGKRLLDFFTKTEQSHE